MALVRRLQFLARRPSLWGCSCQNMDSYRASDPRVREHAYNLISEMAYCHFYHILLITYSAGTVWEGTTQRCQKWGVFGELSWTLAGTAGKMDFCHWLQLVGVLLHILSSYLSYLFLSWGWMAVHVLIIPNMKLSGTTLYVINML